MADRYGARSKGHPDDLSFGERIKDRLEDLGMTQKTLAEKTGLPKQTISNIINERWENSGSITNAVPIAKALDTTVDYLFGVTDDPERPGKALRTKPHVRQLVHWAERLPEREINDLIDQIRARVKTQRRDLVGAEARRAFEDVLRRFDSIEAFLDWFHSVQTQPEFSVPSDDEAPGKSQAQTNDLPLFARVGDRTPA